MQHDKESLHGYIHLPVSIAPFIPKRKCSSMQLFSKYIEHHMRRLMFSIILRYLLDPLTSLNYQLKSSVYRRVVYPVQYQLFQHSLCTNLSGASAKAQRVSGLGALRSKKKCPIPSKFLGSLRMDGLLCPGASNIAWLRWTRTSMQSCQSQL
jgi:hypothetical protein